jgi:ubiquinone/menaquinone biosynthesis C-methylase UbiE
MNPIKKFYNNSYFENLHETKPFLEYLDKEIQEIKKIIPGGKVLDVGCGSGRSTAILCDLAEEVMGIDFSKRLLEQAKEKLQQKSNVKFYLEDAKSTHFKDEEFDTIAILWNTFGNLHASRDKVLQEAKRILKPNGRIILSVFSEKVLSSYLEMLKENNLEIESQDEDYVFLKEGMISERFTKNKLKEIFNRYDLEGEIKPLTEISYLCIIRKK